MDHEKAVEGVQGVAVAIAKEMPILGTALKISIAVRDSFLPNGDKRLDDWVRDEAREVVFRQFPEALKRIEALEAAGAEPKVSDFVHVANAFARAWTTAADSKKRKLLEDAFVRSFDRELYESGLLNVLWGHLDRLSYGDLFLLRELHEADRAAMAKERKLNKGGSLGSYHAASLRNEQLVWSHMGVADVVYIEPTELGSRLYQLAWKPADAAPSDAAEEK
jgi:hypothetical protein